MKKLLIITLLLISIQTFGQYNRELGVNLRTTTYDFLSPLFNNYNSGAGMEVFYKKHGATKTDRLSAALAIIPDGRQDWDTIYGGAISERRTRGKLTVKKGYEKVLLNKGKADFYIGGDLGGTLFYANSSLDIIGSANGVIPMKKRSTWSGNVLFYPFAGVRMPLKKRFNFTMEVTLPIGVDLSNRHFSDGDGNWLLSREVSMIYPKYWIDFIGNVGFSYLF
jgi:hypothetical protein